MAQRDNRHNEWVLGMHHSAGGPPGRCPVQPSTPLGPDQVNVYLCIHLFYCELWGLIIIEGIGHVEIFLLQFRISDQLSSDDFLQQSLSESWRKHAFCLACGQLLAKIAHSWR
jgi:hypothetical protein